MVDEANGNYTAPREIDFHEDLVVRVEENDILDIENNERYIFTVLYRRLSNDDFLTLVKLFCLYAKSVLSFSGKIQMNIGLRK